MCSVVPLTPGLMEVRLQDVAHKRCLVLRILLPLLRRVLAGQQPPCQQVQIDSVVTQHAACSCILLQQPATRAISASTHNHSRQQG